MCLSIYVYNCKYSIDISFNSTVVGCTGPQTQQKRFVRINSKFFNQHGAANVLCEGATLNHVE